MVGSLFYGSLLGIFVLAFYFHRIGANAAFIGVIAGETVVLLMRGFTTVGFLWYNVIGCAVVISVAILVQGMTRQRTA
jgi:Na+/proline symporter